MTTTFKRFKQFQNQSLTGQFPGIYYTEQSINRVACNVCTSCCYGNCTQQIASSVLQLFYYWIRSKEEIIFIFVYPVCFFLLSFENNKWWCKKKKMVIYKFRSFSCSMLWTYSSRDIQDLTMFKTLCVCLNIIVIHVLIQNWLYKLWTLK